MSVPNVVAPKDLDSTLSGMINSVKMAAPKHLDADRLIRLCLTTIKKDQNLLSCWRNNKASVLASFMDSVQLGLEIDSRGLAFLIPYKGECTFQVGYKGYISLAMRSGKLRNIYAEVVYESEQDNVNIELGLSRNLTHHFDFKIPRSGAIILAYAVAVFLDGSTHFEYVQPQDVERAKKKSQSFNSSKPQYSPWNTDEPEMWKKTAIKRLCKYLDLSPELAEAISKDDENDYQKQPQKAVPLQVVGKGLDMYEPEVIDIKPAPSGDSGELSGNSEQLIDPWNAALERYKTLLEKHPDIASRTIGKKNIESMDANTIDGICDIIEDEAGEI